ncbi:MAG: hypothetical protein JSV56_03320 [Methanomassiliicoccales archaeon]|nr:MAG: hypothetical protein JSV56_03320 [Methanomassiliicoccales archaeon]
MKQKLSCLATGIGSLPHTSSEDACDFILRNLKEIPFWPQLPKLSFKENMYAQFVYQVPNAIIDESNKRVYIDTSRDPQGFDEFLADILAENLEPFAYEEDYFHGFYKMLGMEDSLKNIDIFKGQITGPVSLGFQVTDENRKPIFYNDVYRDIMTKNLKMMAKWQEKALRKLCDRTMIFLDEPYLSMIGSAFVSLDRSNAIEYMNEVLSAIEGIKAIHCCANTDWSLVLETDIEVLNFDAYGYTDNLLLYSDKVIEFLERGGIIAWGIVPTNEEELDKESSESLTERLEESMRRLAQKGISHDDILSSSLITPSCGLGPTSVRCAENVLPILREISDKMREKYGL